MTLGILNSLRRSRRHATVDKFFFLKNVSHEHRSTLRLERSTGVRCVCLCACVLCNPEYVRMCGVCVCACVLEISCVLVADCANRSVLRSHDTKKEFGKFTQYGGPIKDCKFALCRVLVSRETSLRVRFTFVRKLPFPCKREEIRATSKTKSMSP